MPTSRDHPPRHARRRPGIHDLGQRRQGTVVDARAEPGHDGRGSTALTLHHCLLAASLPGRRVRQGQPKAAAARRRKAPSLTTLGSARRNMAAKEEWRRAQKRRSPSPAEAQRRAGAGPL
jgi:hypothetical protein